MIVCPKLVLVSSHGHENNFGVFSESSQFHPKFSEKEVIFDFFCFAFGVERYFFENFKTPPTIFLSKFSCRKTKNTDLGVFLISSPVIDSHDGRLLMDPGLFVIIV